MPRRRKIFLVNILILLVLLALAEMGVRLFTQRNMPFSERAKANIQYEPHGLWRFQMKPNQDVLLGREGHLTDSVAYHINEWGFRGPEFPMEKPADEYRTIIIGGSHVFDVNAKDCRGNPGWPQGTKERRSIRVINAGVPGSDTRDYPARILQDLRRFQPDYIIILSTWNDLKWIYSYPADRQQPAPPKSIQPNPMAEEINTWDALLGWSAIYRKLRDSYWKKHLKLGEDLAESTESTDRKTDPQAGLQQYATNLRACVDAARSIGAEVSLWHESRLAVDSLPPPFQKKIRLDLIPQLSTFEALLQAYSSCDSVIDSVVKQTHCWGGEEGISATDCPECFEDHTHYTDHGSRLASQKFFHREYEYPPVPIHPYWLEHPEKLVPR